jgi:hypothetical protein
LIQHGVVEQAHRGRLGFHGGRPARSGGEQRHEFGRVLLEHVDERRIELAPRMLADERDRGRDIAEQEAAIGVERDLRDAHGQRNLLAARLRGVSTAVPTLEALMQRRQKVFGEAHATCQHYGCFTVLAPDFGHLRQGRKHAGQ